MHTAQSPLTAARPGRRRSFRKYWQLYALLLLPCTWFLLFCYVPMFGASIAFKDYQITKGILRSPWVGLKYLRMFFSSYSATSILLNTLYISLYSLAVGFPTSILLALLINESKKVRLKKMVQSVTYAPYFISTVVLVSMVTLFLSPTSGVLNTIIEHLGGERYNYMGNASFFRIIYVWSGVWQGMGYTSVIYIAALAGVSPELYEAAIIDGATRIQRILHISLPSILPTISIMFIFAAGSLMSVGFEKVYLMQNTLNLDASEIIATYVYKVGLNKAQYSFSTAVGLMNSSVNFILLVLVNRIVRALGGSGIW